MILCSKVNLTLVIMFLNLLSYFKIHIPKIQHLEVAIKGYFYHVLANIREVTMGLSRGVGGGRVADGVQKNFLFL